MINNFPCTRDFEIRRPDGTPLPENHHLEFRPDKNVWRVKVTLKSENPLHVGTRKVIPIHTSDPVVARMVRDDIIADLCMRGMMARPVQVIGRNDPERGDNSST